MTEEYLEDCLKDYIDLTKETCDLTKYKIEPNTDYNCAILDNTETPNEYRGFILAKSEKGEAYTICDVNFHATNNRFGPKYGVRLIFRRTNKDLQDKTVNKGQSFQRIDFGSGKNGYREFWKMIAFLEKFKEMVDVGEFRDEFKVVSKNEVVSSIKSVEQDERSQYLVGIIEESGLNGVDIENALALKRRQHDLEVFKLLLKNEDGYIAKYKAKHGILASGEEAAWHHFFKAHKWIFGLSLDLKFMDDFLDESHVGDPNTENRGNPTVDYMGITDFTTLIEIKTPNKKFFVHGETQSSRTNTWSFSRDFLDAISQGLAQKDALLKSISHKVIVGNDNRIINKEQIRTVDPKIVLVFGDKSKKLPIDSDTAEGGNKRDTLERFIRDSRNVTVITFDELYKRAEAIAKLTE